MVRAIWRDRAIARALFPQAVHFIPKVTKKLIFCHFTTRCLQPPDNLIFICNVRQVQEYLKID
jgi:hypothetical protein